MTSRAVRLFFSIILAFPLFASGVAGRHLIVPVVARAPGAFGSDWRTDLMVSNVGSQDALVGILLRDERGLDLGSRTIRPGQTVILKDVLRESFRRESSHGWIEVNATPAGAVITASARIYNTAAGSFGAQIPAAPVVSLGQDLALEGLSGVSGNRTNAGITNPNAFDDATVSLTLRDVEGAIRATSSMVVRRATMSMINDVFTSMGVAPLEGARLDVQSSLPVYAFASVVTPSGDSDFVAGAARDRAVSDALAPSCASPAYLGFAVHPVGNWMVVFRSGNDAATRTHELEAKYGFKAETIWTTSPLIGFVTEKALSPAALAGLRCEPDVGHLEQNGWIRLTP